MTPPAGSFWKTVGAFVAIGPYVGGLVMGAIALSSDFGGFAETGFWGWLGLPLVALLGYPFGALPAGVTGAACGLISRYIGSRVLWVAAATLIGWGAATVAFIGSADSWKFYGLMGAAGAFVSSLVALQLRPRWKN